MRFIPSGSERAVLLRNRVSLISISLDMAQDGDPAEPRQPAYGPEVLCASWNPLVAAVAEPTEACRDAIAEQAATDAESFLASFYRFQQG